MSVVLVGDGKSLIASRYLGSGSMVLSVTVDTSPSELELVRIKDNARLAYPCEEVDRPPPMFL